LLENKRVEIFVDAKKRKRVWKRMKRKNLGQVASDEWRVMSGEWLALRGPEALLRVN